MILPETEQGALFNSINFQRPIQDGVDSTARYTRRSLQLWPTDTMGPTWQTANGVTWVYGGVIYSQSLPICEVASTNYVGVFGIPEPGVDGDGVFFRNSPAPVMKVAKTTLPNTEFTEAWKNVDRVGKLHSYEIRGKTSNGKVREARVTPEGKVLETERRGRNEER